MSLTGIGLTATPLSTATACALKIGNKIIYEVIINKCNKYKKKQNEKVQLLIKSFDNFYKKSLQDKVIEKKEYRSLCNVYTKYADEAKNESFLYIRIQIKN